METVRYYDSDTQKVVNIPEAEKSDRTIRGLVQGVKGEVYFDHHLPDELVERIRRVAETFAEVQPDPLETWVYDFACDSWPEGEVECFEAMAAVFGRVVRKSDPLRVKKEFYAVVMGCSCFVGWRSSEEEGKRRMWSGRKYNYLRKSDVTKVCDAWLGECKRRYGTQDTASKAEFENLVLWVGRPAC